MAIKNINANIITCLHLKHDNRKIPTYESIFDIIVAERVNGKLYSPKMDIIVETTTIIEKEKEFDNFIQRDNNYKCAIAVTFEGDDFKILGEFNIDTKTSQLSSCGKKVWFYNKTCCAESEPPMTKVTGFPFFRNRTAFLTIRVISQLEGMTPLSHRNIPKIRKMLNTLA